jgi:hypothetical protein
MVNRNIRGHAEYEKKIAEKRNTQQGIKSNRRVGGRGTWVLLDHVVIDANGLSLMPMV